MIPNIQRQELVVVDTDATSDKVVFIMDKPARILDIKYFITSENATALVWSIDQNDFEDAGTPVVLGTISLAAADLAGTVAELDLEGVEIARHQAVVCQVSTASTAGNKGGRFVLRYIESEDNV